MNPEKIKLLHSRYNPQGEAERYISSLSLNESIRFLILIEPGLGYMVAPLRKKLPSAKIIALHAEANPEGEAGINGPEAPDSEWHPGMGIPVQDFLEREIPDVEAAELRILEWRPALSVYGGAYRALVEGAVEFIKRTDANTRTLKNFGGSWFRNFFKNLGIIRKILCPLPLSQPLLVTGAGPGLEDTIHLIKNSPPGTGGRGIFFILAASSSAAALEAADLKADLVISTDGGNWARLHLYECYRKGEPNLAVSLTAALPSQCESSPVLPICDGSLWQTLILRELKIPFIVLPQRGTVSASALDLAFALTKGDIFIAGMDLSNRDIRSHVRPYSLDFLLEEKAGRLNPVYSQSYRRSSMLKAGGSYGIYASWFEKQLPSYPRRLHSLGKNNPLFNSLENTGLPFDKTTVPDPVQFETLTLKYEENPSIKALAVLEKALTDPRCPAKLPEELGALLFPGRERPSAKELIDTLHSLAGRYRAKPPAGRTKEKEGFHPNG